MSRIGRKPINIPEKVKVTINNGRVMVEGPKGSLSEDIPEGIDVNVEGTQILVTRRSETKRIRSLHGLARVLVANMVTGVSEGFSKMLRITGLGYRAAFENGRLTMQLRASHPIVMDIPKGIDIAIQRAETVQNQPEIPLTVSGIDKHLVGHIAALIRDFQRPEPYRGKGIKYATEHVRRKVGKAAAA